jgi:molybdate transport system regulatory protein
VNAEVVLALSGGDRIVATITRESLKALGLRPGGEAFALVKASWVILATEDAAAGNISARNRLTGRVQKPVRGAVNTDVSIALAGGNTVNAIVTNVSARELGLRKGRPVSAVFKASSVILGVGS